MWLVYCENIGYLKRQIVFKLKMVSYVLEKTGMCENRPVLQEEHASLWLGATAASSWELQQVT